MDAEAPALRRVQPCPAVRQPAQWPAGLGRALPKQVQLAFLPSQDQDVGTCPVWLCRSPEVSPAPGGPAAPGRTEQERPRCASWETEPSSLGGDTTVSLNMATRGAAHWGQPPPLLGAGATQRRTWGAESRGFVPNISCVVVS